MKKCGGVCFVWWGNHRVATVGAAIEINWLRLFQNGSQCHQPSEYYARSTKLTLRYLLEGHGMKNHRTAYIAGSKRKLVGQSLCSQRTSSLPSPPRIFKITPNPSPLATSHWFSLKTNPVSQVPTNPRTGKSHAGHRDCGTPPFKSARFRPGPSHVDAR
jgi:hypothetical protein